MRKDPRDEQNRCSGRCHYKWHGSGNSFLDYDAESSTSPDDVVANFWAFGFKYIALLHNIFRGKRSQVRKSIYSALKKNDKEARDKLFQEPGTLAQGDTHAMDNLKKCKTYLTNHWDEAVVSMDPDTPRSYTEAMVQKMSARFTAAPMTWVYEHALNLLKYKIYFENGGTTEDMDSAPRVGGTLKKYRAEIEAFIESIEDGNFDFSLFGESVPTPMDGSSATQRQIRNVGHGGGMQSQ